MAANKQLARFVRDALGEGRSRPEIETALTDAGWTPLEVSEGLGAWSETAFVPPVPRPQSVVSARDFFVYALTFGALIFLATHFVVLCHNLIEIAYDASYFGYRGRSVRWSMAVIAVAGPLYFWLLMRDRARLRDDPSLYRSSIRKWLTYIALLITAAVLLGSVVAVIYALLEGDLTVEFLAKMAVTMLTAGVIFGYYRRDTVQGDT